MENEAAAMSLYHIANYNMKSLPPLPPLVVKKVDGRSVPGSKAPFRNGLISVEEMTRLMRVYGPIKSTRESKKSADKKPVKLLSIKRKFYRWFPDFDDRSVDNAAILAVVHLTLYYSHTHAYHFIHMWL